jgi:asparagine synthase (glutamine-hydrolysing)
MCGITGIVARSSSTEERFAAQLQSMTDILAHRGPDDQGCWHTCLPDGRLVGLGSRRLAILDLSPAGHMPMSTPDGLYTIVFNGEIYNYPELKQKLEAKGYAFRSGSDTEAVLYLYREYGEDCLQHLNGMFAIAIWDARRQRMFLARDHFGIKPLYYCKRDGEFGFSSEVKALLQLPWVDAKPSPAALSQFLTFAWVPDPDTMFEGIYKLPAGHFAVLEHGELSVAQYWDITFPGRGHEFRLTEEQLLEEIRSRFRQSVHSQMLSDVPIGAFLSAGIDSSSIVAAMSAFSNHRVKTYTITFPEKYRVGEKTLDDPNVARRIAKRLNCEHHEIVVEPNVTELLPKLIWHMDEPVADPAIIAAYLVCNKARETVTVLLSGVGGDEVFAGYRKHYAHAWSQFYRKLPEIVRRPFESAVLNLPSMRGTAAKGMVRLLKKMARSGSLRPRDAFITNCTYLDETQKAQLLTAEFAECAVNSDALRRHREYFEEVEEADFLNQMLYLDLKAFMVSLNLTYNDKMGMASSLEVRVPFLDRELMEFVAWNVRPSLKIKGFLMPQTKYIFRTAMKPLLPREVLQQPKAGFGVPVDYWLANDLREMVDDLLSEQTLKNRGYFNASAVRALVEEHRSGAQDWSMQVWQLLTFELWLQEFVDKTHQPSMAMSGTGTSQ